MGENAFCFLLFLPHSSGWLGIVSCSTLIPQGKGFANIGMLNNTHFSRVYFLPSVGGIGPCRPVINRSSLFPCSKTLGVEYCLPFLSSLGQCFSVNQFCCSQAPKDRLGFQENSVMSRYLWNTAGQKQEPICTSVCMKVQEANGRKLLKEREPACAKKSADIIWSVMEDAGLTSPSGLAFLLPAPCLV